ncbi:hypothetical protein BDZ91DRAFT_720688 [Kalaharituber pfeilii]|nr:hypothetical protein BDZ91DRAFT_720688 [Kalaharituber pfeilii]
MLRRPPTAIKLTQEDLALYEDAKREREREAGLVNQQDVNPHDGLKGSGDGGKRGTGRSREERIGVSGGTLGAAGTGR